MVQPDKKKEKNRIIKSFLIQMMISQLGKLDNWLRSFLCLN